MFFVPLTHETENGSCMTLLYLTTDRLELVAATAELMELEMADLPGLSRLLRADIPQAWPPKLVGNMIDQFVIRRLRETPGLIGWSYWYWILREPTAPRRFLLGRSHFCPPRKDGSVEIAYEVLEPFRCFGFGTEGVKALTQWAFSHSHVHRVIADAYSAASARVLEKNGYMKICEAPQMNMKRFEITCLCTNRPRIDDRPLDAALLTAKDQPRCGTGWLKKWFRITS
jgi:[ribosomal protein S5]-alanine N-acetyltransferase